jgi:hypothetical protein
VGITTATLLRVSARHQHRLARVAMLALLAVVVAMAGAFVHTDDGCAVEQHCRACRVAHASAGAVPVAAAPLPAIEPADALATSATFASPAAPLVSDSNRGPPAAL